MEKYSNIAVDNVDIDKKYRMALALWDGEACWNELIG